MTSLSALPSPDLVSQRLLATLGKRSVPIDLSRITGTWKDLHVVPEQMDGAGYLLPLGRLGAEILVNEKDSPERQRFTIAHELGHWVLGLTWHKKTGEFRRPPGTKRETIEKWCDRFATNLLMPGDSIKEYFASVPDPTFVKYVLRAPGVFQVSDEAMFIRLWELLRVQVASVEIDKKSGTPFVQKDYGDESARALLSEILETPEVVEHLRSTFICFSVRAGNRVLKCSGKWRSSSNTNPIFFVVRHQV